MSESVILGIFTVIGAALGAVLPIIISQREKKKSEAHINLLKKENTEIEKKLEISRKVLPKDLEIIEDVDDVLQNKVLPILREKVMKRQEIRIINFGLDLYSVMPWLKNKIIHPIEFDNVYFEMRSLIINPDSNYLKDLVNGDSNISSEVIASSIKTAQDLGHLHDLTKFSLEIRQYDLPPIYHGFIINNEHLFLGFTELENGKLVGGIKPYIHLKIDSDSPTDFTVHYFTFFTDWFEFYWKQSKQVAYVKK